MAYSTGLTNFFPLWSRDGGIDAFIARLGDAAVAPRIRQEALPRVDLIGGWDNVQISSVRVAEDRDVEGKRLGTAARMRDIDPYDLAVGLLQRSHGDVSILGFAMSEENLDRILALSLASAIQKMTSMPAGRVRLADRGRLAKGLAAEGQRSGTGNGRGLRAT